MKPKCKQTRNRVIKWLSSLTGLWGEELQARNEKVRNTSCCHILTLRVSDIRPLQNSCTTSKITTTKIVHLYKIGVTILSAFVSNI